MSIKELSDISIRIIGCADFINNSNQECINKLRGNGKKFHGYPKYLEPVGTGALAGKMVLTSLGVHEAARLHALAVGA